MLRISDALRRARITLATLAIAVNAISSVTARVESAQLTASNPPEPSAGEQQSNLKQRVESYVQKITRNSGISERDSLVRWNAPICLFATGFRAEDTALVLSRLSLISSSAGATVAREPCQANFVIVATAEPDRVLAAWDGKNKQLFGNASPDQIHHFLEASKSHPVRIWRNIDYGRRSTSRFGHFIPSDSQAESSPFVGVAPLQFYSIFEIIDTNRTAHANLNQLIDYVAMMGLSNIDVDADIGRAPSILRLFTLAADSAPEGLSNWDIAFLQALYRSDPASQSQRSDIAARVLLEVSS